MTKDQLWQAYCERNPSFKDDDAHVTMTARGLKKLFNQTWDKGAEQGKVVGRISSKVDDFAEKFKQAISRA